MNSHTSMSKKVPSADEKRDRSTAEQRFRRSRLTGEMRRHTYYARLDLLEKVREYAYGERVGISELMNRILEGFFEEREDKPESRGK